MCDTDAINIADPEYTIPGELEAPARVEAWPERTDRRILRLERQMNDLQTTVEQLLDLLEEQVG